MKDGIVKWYSEKKGYGFIETDSDGDVFMHSSQIKDHGFFTLDKNDRVTFDLRETRQGVQAFNVRRKKDMCRRHAPQDTDSHRPE